MMITYDPVTTEAVRRFKQGHANKAFGTVPGPKSILDFNKASSILIVLFDFN